MRRFDFVTVDVFTSTQFGGNQLAVFPDAEGLSDREMQALAAEMNYSETSFVLPAANAANSAQVRIFNRTAEMPFAGHPNVGTGFVLALLGPETTEVLHFEELAGIVEVRIVRGADGIPAGAEIDAPQPLRILGELPVKAVAECIGLPADALRDHAHPPLRATVGVDFVLVEVEPDALPKASPDLPRFKQTVRACLDAGSRMSILLYARDGAQVTSRMFAPLSGTWEDPATGSANAALGALLLSLTPEATASFQVTQGLEMGRPSMLFVKAWRAPDGIRASGGGNCVPVFRGTVDL